MADHALDDDYDGDIFIYRGGRAPQHITHAIIDDSIDEIDHEAFENCHHLVQVETHNGLRRIGMCAFRWCRSLRRINLKSVVEIMVQAFAYCVNLEYVEFGDSLVIIEGNAFLDCDSLTHLNLPSIITIENHAFCGCTQLTGVELSERLQTIDEGAFLECDRLQRIAVPPKRDLFEFRMFTENFEYYGYNQFDGCVQLTSVDLVGGIHKTVVLLHMESWRTEMTAEIDRIDQVLRNRSRLDNAADLVRQWMHSVIDKMDNYKAGHNRYVREGVTLLELALWKAKLGEKEDDCAEGKSKKAKVDVEGIRKERRVTCGADIVIKNVIPYLKLE